MDYGVRQLADSSPNRLFRESLAVALGDHISRVISVGHVDDLEAYRNEAPPDIAILDICLVGGEGMKVAAYVRSLLVLIVAAAAR